MCKRWNSFVAHVIMILSFCLSVCLSFSVFNASLIQGSNEPREFFVGEVTSYILHNLSPSTTYDVNVYAQYDSGMSIPLTDQGTTCKSE